MWEIFFFAGVIFLSLGFYELKKVKSSNIDFSPQLEHKVKNLSEGNKPSVIPLKITVQPEPQQKEKNQDNMTFIPLEGTHKMGDNIEEKKRLWENHWIVKKVKERFENKNETSSVDNQPQQPSKNDAGQVFRSLIEGVEHNALGEDTENKNIEQPHLSQENLPSTLPQSPTQENPSSDNESKDEKSEKEKKEKEFDPFEVLGY